MAPLASLCAPAPANTPEPFKVLRLPSAATQPVVQQSRRGRLPKHVPTLWRARLDRSGATRVLQLQAQLAFVQGESAQAYTKFMVAFSAMKAAEREVDRLSAIHKELIDLTKCLKAQLGKQHA